MKLLPILFLIPVLASATVTIDWVTVGNPGNAPDSTGYGAVGYTYNIGKNEVTISQYAEFLNAVAKSDPYNLYRLDMEYDSAVAGIARSGSGTVGDPYSYGVIGSGNRPVTYVTWFNAARFVNWLHNGQGSGSTELGVYNLNGAIKGSFSRQPDAKVWLPTEDEWYKAAYYDPTKNIGAGGYWLHANQSDSVSSNRIGDSGAANFLDGNHTFEENGLSSYLTEVGAYGADSRSHYETNDQAGNVWEWSGTQVDSKNGLIRGGAFASPESELRSDSRVLIGPTSFSPNVGFRLAGIPESSTMTLLALFGFSFLTHRRRH